MKQKNSLRVGMVAGEPSSDYLASHLLNIINEVVGSSSVVAEGIGGPLMRKEGFNALFPMHVLAHYGLVAILQNIIPIYKVRSGLLRHFSENLPHVFIGIDSSAFNLPVEKKLHRAGVKIIHYVSPPSIWACRSYRIRTIRRSVDLLLVLFPFEVDLYKQHGMEAVFVGHPLATKIPLQPDKQGARHQYAFDDDEVVLAILPGSRVSELKRHLPIFIKAAILCRKKIPNLRFISNALDNHTKDKIMYIWKKFAGDNVPIIIEVGKMHQVLTASDIAIVASGTVSLEAMLTKTPVVVGYQLPILNWICSLIFCSHRKKDRVIALPNILAMKKIIPELWQFFCTPKRLAKQTLNFLLDKERCVIYREESTRIHRSLLLDRQDEIVFRNRLRDLLQKK